jgi:hypothetical protein
MEWRPSVDVNWVDVAFPNFQNEVDEFRHLFIFGRQMQWGDSVLVWYTGIGSQLNKVMNIFCRQ